MIAGVGLTLESVYAGLALGESVGRELHLDGGSAQALVAGVERDRGKVAELGIPLELAAPGIDAGFYLGFDLIFTTTTLGSGPIGAAHGALKEDLSLLLRVLAIEIAIGKRCGGRYRRLVLQR